MNNGRFQHIKVSSDYVNRSNQSTVSWHAATATLTVLQASQSTQLPSTVSWHTVTKNTSRHYPRLLCFQPLLPK